MNQMVKSQPAPLALRQIVELQFSGELQAAHDAYVDFFQRHDPDYNALNLFGICCVFLGKLEKAERIFEHVIHEAPHISEARIHLANCRFDQGKMEAALEAFQKAQACERDTVEVQTILARVHMALGHQEEAKEALKTALSLKPCKPETLLALAGMHKALGEAKDAMFLYKKVLFDDPNNCDALLGLADIHRAREDWDAVMVNTEIILEQFPAHLKAGHLRARALKKLNRPDEMVALAKAMADKAPDDIEVVTLLCSALHEAEEYASAIYAADHALQIDPKAKEPMFLRSSSYFRLGRHEIALHQINDLLQKYPDYSDARQNKAVILERMLRLDESITIYDQMLAKTPDDLTLKSNKAYCLLLKGDLKEGFRLWESRFNKKSKVVHFYRGGEPVWNGEDIEGKHLLVHPEQGYGDTIMACRFIKLLEGRGARITFAVPKHLKSIMETLETKAKVIAVGDAVEKVDFHVPLMSLAHLTANQWDTIPAEPHYLKVPTDAQVRWDDRFGATDGLRIGFVCSGNPDHSNDAARSLNMMTFLKALPAGPEYHLLQRDLRDTDLAAVSRRKDIITYQKDISDFADTSALCMKMDLVISVDTSVAHLAGALGRPTIVMLSAWPDWRWGLGRVQDTWYPNTRLVRQKEINDWRSVLNYIPFLIGQEMKRRAVA